MREQARRNLVLTIAPDMSKNRHDPECRGQLAILPEFVVDSLAPDAEKVIHIFKAAVERKLSCKYFLIRNSSESICNKDDFFPESSCADHLAIL